MDILVSTEWLESHIHDEDLVVLDCSVRTEQGENGLTNVSGLEDYNLGHIPTAGFADLKGNLCDNGNPVEFAIPSPEHFCKEMSELGVGDTSRVVLYDSGFSAWAARVWWMLRWVGFDRAAILDGGSRVWIAEGRPLSTSFANRAAKHLTPRPRPELIADRDEVLRAIGNPAVNLIDTLPPESFRGEMQVYDRPGHIPTARNISGMSLLDESGRYRPMSDLEPLFAEDRKTRVITYCGGGILASSSAFIMHRLGFRDVAVYTASLQEWAADPANPMTVDPDA